jgi:hypothetical protein
LQPNCGASSASVLAGISNCVSSPEHQPDPRLGVGLSIETR